MATTADCMRTRLIGWALLPIITPRRIRALLERFVPLDSIANASDRSIAETLTISRSEAALVRDPLKMTALAAQVERHRQAAVTLLDAEYPPLLRQIGDPPPALFVEGDREVLKAASLAVVGSRRSSPYGANAARWLAADLAAAGVVVVSGFARGIDAAAHEGALRAAVSPSRSLERGSISITRAGTSACAAKSSAAGRWSRSFLWAPHRCPQTSPCAIASSRA